MSVAVANRFQSVKLKYLGRLSNGATPSSSEATFWDGDIVWVTPDDLGKLEGRYISDSKRKITDEGYASCGTRLVSPDSIVISTRAPIGHLAILKSDACFNQGCKALSPNERLVPEFGYYCLLSAKSDLQNLGLGTTFIELSRNSLANFRIGTPSIGQQTAIVSYLDSRCAEIDDLIAKKRRSLELLAEKRAAIITRAVTKGLNPDAPLKPSGIDWLGDIPAHWEARRVKFLAEYNRETLPEGTDPDLEIEYVEISGVSLSEGIKETQTLTFEAAPTRARRIVRNGDVIISTVRTYLRAIATIHGAPPNLIVSTGFAVLSPDKEMHPAFFGFACIADTFVNAVVARSRGVSYPATNASDIANIHISFPPFDEQRRIAQHLTEALARIDTTHGLIDLAINQLSEYRSALITKAVTGEIEVG